eukprot:8198-Heterococcus_DN1.PRE.7
MCELLRTVPHRSAPFRTFPGGSNVGGQHGPQEAELPTDGVGNWTYLGESVYAQLAVEGGTKIVQLTDKQPGHGARSGRGRSARVDVVAYTILRASSTLTRCNTDARCARHTLQRTQSTMSRCTGVRTRLFAVNSKLHTLLTCCTLHYYVLNTTTAAYAHYSRQGGDLYQEAAAELIKESQDPDLTVEVKFGGAGISFVGPQYPPVGVTRPVLRAELIYAEASDLYVDNHMDGAPYAVAFAPRGTEYCHCCFFAVCLRAWRILQYR